MNKKILGLIIVIVGIASLAAVVYFVFWPKDSNTNNNQPNNQQNNQPIDTEKGSENQEQDNKNQETTEREERSEPRIFSGAQIEGLASSFVERFGTYSNQSDYENLRSLMPFMTEKMKSWAQENIKENKQNEAYYGIYYGIETRAVSKETTELDRAGGRASVLVKTLRKENKGDSANSNSFRQDIKVEMIRENGVWKVDGAYWQ